MVADHDHADIDPLDAIQLLFPSITIITRPDCSMQRLESTLWMAAGYSPS